MDILCATDKTYTAHAMAPQVDIFFCSGNYFGMAGKAQVIIGTKVQYCFAANNDLGALFTGNNAFCFGKAGCFYFGEFCGNALYKILVHKRSLKGKCKEKPHPNPSPLGRGNWEIEAENARFLCIYSVNSPYFIYFSYFS